MPTSCKVSMPKTYQAQGGAAIVIIAFMVGTGWQLTFYPSTTNSPQGAHIMTIKNKTTNNTDSLAVDSASASEVYIAKEVISCASERYYGHQTTKSELDDHGNKIKVTRRKDGTTTIKSSGPCGRSDYDENGNLC